jgi:hypothetical protein
MRTTILALAVVLGAVTPALAESNNLSTASAEASRASVEAVGNGLAAVGTLVAIPPMAIANLGQAMAEGAKTAPLPLGDQPVTVGPSPDRAIRK